jgi:translation initiation factor 1
MRKSASSGGLVYSTEGGRMCPACRQPIASCRCAAAPPTQGSSVGDGIARIRREVAGRGGKTVTSVTGLALDEPALVALSKRLKAACGTGGTVRGGVLELQGDHVDALISLLSKEGFKAKRAGG